MPRDASDNTVQVAFKIPPALLKQIDALAKRLQTRFTDGVTKQVLVKVTRTETMRWVLQRGTEEWTESLDADDSDRKRTSGRKR